MSKAIISDWPNKSRTQQAAPPRIMHLQFSMQKKVCIFNLVQLGGEKRTFSIEAGEGGACLKIALRNTMKDQPLIMIVFMRSIQRLWVLRELLTRDKDLMQNLFQTLCLDQF